MDRNALMPTKPPKGGRHGASGATSRTAVGLLIIAGLLVVYHYARQDGHFATGVPVIAPALHNILRGEVVAMNGPRLTVRVEDTRGGLTHLTRTIQLTNETRYHTPGHPTLTGPAGMTYLKQGYRILVHGLAAQDGQTVNASEVAVSFPPVTGQLTSVVGSDLVVSVPGQAAPLTISATSHTAFFVAGGRWSTLARGAPVRVWIAPSIHQAGQFRALTVAVGTPTTPHPSMHSPSG